MKMQTGLSIEVSWEQKYCCRDLQIILKSLNKQQSVFNNAHQCMYVCVRKERIFHKELFFPFIDSHTKRLSWFVLNKKYVFDPWMPMSTIIKLFLYKCLVPFHFHLSNAFERVRKIYENCKQRVISINWKSLNFFAPFRLLSLTWMLKVNVKGFLFFSIVWVFT